MINKSVKHFLNLICTFILSLCFALSFSFSSFASGTDSVSFGFNPSGLTSRISFSNHISPEDTTWYDTLGGHDLCHVNFDSPIYLTFTSNSGNSSGCTGLSGVFVYSVSIDYMDSNLATYRTEILNGSFNFNFSNGGSRYPVNTSLKLGDLQFNGDVAGTPIGIYVDFSSSNVLLNNANTNAYNLQFSINCPSFSFANVAVLDDGNGDSQQVEIEFSPEQISTNGLMSTNGFSPLILATNGNVRYFENLGLYDCKFGYPAFNMSDFEGGSSAQLTLFEGQFDGVSVHPVAFMGDCRKGEYEVVFGFITTSNPIHDQGVDFSSGWTGELVYSQQAFALFTNDTKYNYRVQYNPIDGYFYNTVWIRFETDREFDSLTIRTGPRITGLVHGAFCVNKFVGTVADQLNLDNYQWNYQPTNINQFNQNNSSTGGVINSADSAEQGFFDNYDSAVSSSGIENFDLSVIGNSLLFVQLLVNRFYSILPDKLQYLIFASLVFGVLGAILGVTRYVIKHESRVSRSKASDKKGD